MGPRRVLLVHGARDAVVPPSDSTALAGAIPHGLARALLLPGADHGFSGAESESAFLEAVAPYLLAHAAADACGW